MAAAKSQRPSRNATQRRARVAPRRTPEAAESRDLHEVVLEAATRLLADEGWDQVTTNRIAKVSGVSVGFVYRYFPNREAVARAVVHRQWNRELALLERVLLEGGTLVSLTRAYVDLVAATAPLQAQIARHLIHLVTEDAAAWDRRVIDAIVAAFDREFEDDPRKRLACENLFVVGIEIARRAAQLRPEALARGDVADELVRLAEAYLGTFTRRR